MIIPSIDIEGGETVQLVGGKERALSAGDPRPLARRFGRTGDTALIDLDAARGRGSNRALIESLLDLAPCRVGGGIRDYDTAARWLDAGAAKIIIGTAAAVPLLRRLPRDRVIAALDGVDGELVVEGWQSRTGVPVLERMAELREHVSGFLVTFVEREGRMQGIDLEAARGLQAAAGAARLTVAGGIREASEVAVLDANGVDTQVGMALYTGRFDVADALAAMLRSERDDGLWPTVVCDDLGQALGLAWSSLESLRDAIRSGRGVYQSRSRGRWVKGATSGNHQTLLRVALDCDRDALRFTVRQHGEGFCHLGTWDCFGDARGLARLERRIHARVHEAPPGSYTRRLLDDPALLHAKLVEEAEELAGAATLDEVREEAADLIYFTMTRLCASGVSLASVSEALDRRSRAFSRRGGEVKTEPRT